jgi:pimeloyl-ACP methyl ester carboxylesterase
MSPPAETIKREVIFPSGSLNLAGTLLLPGPDQRWPAVLLIPGSGQVDRDEDAKKLPINVMREIAVHLAGQGIASFRYDKRGVGASEGSYWDTGFLDGVGDAQAALTWLKSQDHIQRKKVFVLGHSEGAGIAIRLAGTGADLAGIILLAGWARNSEEILLWQAEKVIPGMHGFNKWLIDVLHIDIRKNQIKQFEKIKRSKKNWYRQLNVKVNAKWLREFLGYTPGDDMKNIRVPVLAITGSKDIQVDPADLRLMAGLVKDGFEGHELPDVTHLLRVDPGVPTTATYPDQVKRPVDQRVLTLISSWLRKQGAA